MKLQSMKKISIILSLVGIFIAIFVFAFGWLDGTDDARGVLVTVERGADNAPQVTALVASDVSPDKVIDAGAESLPDWREILLTARNAKALVHEALTIKDPRYVRAAHDMIFECSMSDMANKQPEFKAKAEKMPESAQKAWKVIRDTCEESGGITEQQRAALFHLLSQSQPMWKKISDRKGSFDEAHSHIRTSKDASVVPAWLSWAATDRPELLIGDEAALRPLPAKVVQVLVEAEYCSRNDCVSRAGQLFLCATDGICEDGARARLALFDSFGARLGLKVPAVRAAVQRRVLALT
jgi:hypothetical protein